MTGDHHRRAAERATLLVRVMDEILGTHKTTPIYFAFSAPTCSSTSLVTMHVTVIQPGNGGA
jgi:hypothetical protein